MIREAIVAGQFYPAVSHLLKKQIESMIEKTTRKEKVIGLLSPHAGYIYSGQVAGALFSRTQITDTVVILGPNHTGIGPAFSLYKDGCWRTPLGDVEIDVVVADDISKACNLIKQDKSAHAYEHSIEVQLPFMQYFNSGLKIVPIVVSHAEFEAYESVAQAIASSIKKQKRDIMIVASSDMSHYEPHQRVQQKDKIAIDAILKLDEKLLLKSVQEHDISMCGYIPATIMLIAAKLLGAEKARLVKYQTSGDVSGDYSAVVGYAGIMVI